MSLEKAIQKYYRGLYPVTKILHYIGITIIAVLMFLTAIDVILRNITSFLNNIGVGSTVSVKGWYELTEYLMVILVAFTIAYCGIEKGHVVIELILNRLSQRVQAIASIITNFLSLGFFIIITWQSALYVTQITRASTTLLIPAWPFVAVVAVGTAALCFVFLLHFLESIIQVRKT